MATGGIFQLITNDGKQDKMLMASDLLKQRLAEVVARRQVESPDDTTPTLYDIERTHILFTNAHFKPFAAIGFEYNKVTNSAGTTALGGRVTFSIPQFGDFFNDMVVHAKISQPILKTVTDRGDPIDSSRQNLMRWCAYPGERLLKNVKFEVNGNPLDEYTSDAVNYHREFMLQPNKRLAWERCNGQEQPEVGYLDQPNWMGSGVDSSSIVSRTRVVDNAGLQTPTGQKYGDVELFIPLLFWCNKDPRLAIPSVAIPYGQRFITLELATAGELVGEVPRGYSEDLTAAAIWGQNTIDQGGAFTTQAELRSIELYINNIFVNPEVHNIFIKRIGFTLIRVHRMQINETNGTGSAKESLLLQNLKWPIEAIFVGMRVKDFHSGGTTAMLRQHLDKWHRFSMVKNETRTTQGWKAARAVVARSGARVLDILTCAFNTAAIRLHAVLNGLLSMTVDAQGTYTLQNDLAFGDLVTFTYNQKSYSFTVRSFSADGVTVVFADVVTADLATLNQLNLIDATFSKFSVTVNSVEPLKYHTQTYKPAMTFVTIKAHGIPIYNDFPTGFFNSYIPYNYGGHNISAPKDCGALMITFCLYPGTYQPSGHINISRAREFYIDYSTAEIVNTENTPCKGTIVIVASAINFLLISDGSAVLRYST